MKTKEETLDVHAQKLSADNFYHLIWNKPVETTIDCALTSMQSYADEQTAPLLKRIAELEKDKWVSVEEPPKKPGLYLVSSNKGVNENYFYDNDCNSHIAKGWHIDYGVTEITHWRPLPQPPIAKAALEGDKK